MSPLLLLKAFPRGRGNFVDGSGALQKKTAVKKENFDGISIGFFQKKKKKRDLKGVK